MTGAEFLPEIGIGWTAVGMMGVEESSNAIARILFVLVMTSDRAAQSQVNSRGYYRGERRCPLKNSKRRILMQNSSKQSL